MKQKHISHQFVEFIPESLDESVLYISKKYKTAAHKCFCGCGEEVITPLTPVDWSLKVVNNKVTMYPSIGNWSYSCRSHYWIQNSTIVWAEQMSEKNIQEGRQQERRLKERYFEKINNQNNILIEQNTKQKNITPKRNGFLHYIYSELKKWWSN